MKPVHLLIDNFYMGEKQKFTRKYSQSLYWDLMQDPDITAIANTMLNDLKAGISQTISEISKQ